MRIAPICGRSSDGCWSMPAARRRRCRLWNARSRSIRSWQVAGTIWGSRASRPGQPERAAEALASVVASEPRNAAAWAALGAAQQQSGELEESDRSLHRVLLEIDPDVAQCSAQPGGDAAAHRSAEAVEIIEDAIRRGLQAPQSQLLRVHLIPDTGKLEDAVDGYRSIVVANPAALEAHEWRVCFRRLVRATAPWGL